MFFKYYLDFLEFFCVLVAAIGSISVLVWAFMIIPDVTSRFFQERFKFEYSEQCGFIFGVIIWTLLVGALVSFGRMFVEG